MFNRKGSFNYYYEDENGDNPTGLSGEINFEGKYNFSPGEHCVMYEKDGSGYPGSPPEFELYDFRATNKGLDAKLIGEWLENKFENDSLRDRLIEHITECIEDERLSYEENKWDYLIEAELDKNNG